jgi:putative transposase
MPDGLKRFQQSKQTHFVTFSCYQRLPRLRDTWLRDLFVECLERTRRSYRFRVYGYVVMPEHVHLLVSEPEVEVLAKAIRYRAELDSPLWQKRYYDHNVRTYESFVEKLHYIHHNPVQRGLAEKPADWNWSSFRHYAAAEIGPVRIESQWTVDRLMSGETPRLLQIRSQ